MNVMAVPLRVMVEEDFRHRLKLLSVAMGMSMGDLIQQMLDKGEKLTDLEKKYKLAVK